ncbi:MULTISPECIES: hypothetical protein [unclassified Tatumella]|uniref:hypothetical protein n=1 Tax=unclassified Tatumella TaxID=2649542 RepID=UPI001BB086EC|nr:MULTISPECIES: hypothetical protein [unclassified Tatumella]MBS0855536.1 hypothetical protein [Tatumella sp. JGM16]MBS0877082.1 hypothetical protein [Tatumella sp. JGM82]MBS0890650.1 hypothetical protein [Tatumella sp. JGM94]MBS0893322.1 hypothetical protein [Tatumella sp. JGM130]MBS0901385.1 hypothetical protein [Tatumella sp. JGM100]
MNKMMKSILAFSLAGTFVGSGMAAETSATQEPVSAATTPVYYSLSDSNGGVFNYLKTKYTAGSADNYDILLVGDSLNAGQSLKNTVIQALNNGKQVIFDGSKGSTKAAQLASQIIGSSVAADAIMFKTSPSGDGYLMTPVELTTSQYSAELFSDEKTTSSVSSDNTPDQIFQ